MSRVHLSHTSSISLQLNMHTYPSHSCSHTPHQCVTREKQRETHQLEFVTPPEGALYARVRPQRLERCHVLVELLRRQVLVAVVVGDGEPVRLVLGVLQRDLQPPPCLHQDLGPLEDVVVDGAAEICAVLLGVVLPVEDPHLLDEGALARLPRAQEQDLYLLAQVDPLLGQLPVDLPAPAQSFPLLLG